MFSFFFFNDTATTEIYTLSLHDALPISQQSLNAGQGFVNFIDYTTGELRVGGKIGDPTSGQRVRVNDPLGRFRSEEHTSELQSQFHLVCRLLLEKKKKT